MTLRADIDAEVADLEAQIADARQAYLDAVAPLQRALYEAYDRRVRYAPYLDDEAEAATAKVSTDIQASRSGAIHLEAIR